MTLLHNHQCTTDGNMRLASKKTETLRDENAFLELKVKTTNFDLFQIYKLFSAICKTFIGPKYSIIYIIVSECVLFLTPFDDLNLYFNLPHTPYLSWGKSAYLPRGTSARRSYHSKCRTMIIIMN